MKQGRTLTQRLLSDHALCRRRRSALSRVLNIHSSIEQSMQRFLAASMVRYYGWCAQVSGPSIRPTGVAGAKCMIYGPPRATTVLNGCCCLFACVALCWRAFLAQGCPDLPRHRPSHRWLAQRVLCTLQRAQAREHAKFSEPHASSPYALPRACAVRSARFLTS